MSASATAKKRGRAVGQLVAQAALVATGYVWAKHGILWGLAIIGGFLVFSLALYGASTMILGRKPG